jgi:HK97 family phage major capsid protein/HK97 family phage prohead protease
MPKKINSEQQRDLALSGADNRRAFELQREAVGTDDRTVEIAFSSELPYERAFGLEVLRHDAESVMLDRLERGAAVLVNHDPGDQVGVVVSARIDSDNVGRAVIRFSQSVRGQEIHADVIDGIRQLVSVGYRIHDYEVEERRGEPDVVTVTRWEPYELSIVAIPADETVGVGRSASPSTDEPATKEGNQMSHAETTKQDVTPAKEPAVDREAELTRIRTDEKRRTDSIRQIADKFQLDELGREAISEGWSVDEFNSRALEKVGERNNGARAESNHDGEVDLSRKDRNQFSLVRLMEAVANPNDRAAQTRAGFELEVSAEAQRGFGSDFNCRGEFVPESLLSQRALDSTATDGGELIGTELLGGSYIEVFRNTSAAMRAGARMLSGLVGNVDIPRQTTGASASWITAEDGDAANSEPQFDQVSLAPKDLACYTEVTRRLLMQSTPSIEAIVRNDLAVAAALGVDLAALYGTGLSGQPEGIAANTGVNTLDLAAADPTYAEIVEMIKKVMAANAIGGTPTFIVEANGWEALSTTPKQGSGVEGNFILGDNDRVKGYPYIMSNQVTAEEYFFGDFSQLLVGEWGGLEVAVDPYTHSLKGKVRYVMFKTVDVAIRQPTAFCYSHDGIA